MRSPAKYLFDNDFGAGERSRSSVPLTEVTAKVADAETAGYRKGFAAAKAETEQHAAAALQGIAAALGELSRGLAAIEAQLETEAVEVAVAVARKLAPALMAREPFAEISALAVDCFRQLVAAPHVVVRVNDGLHESARAELEKTTHAAGYGGRLVVLAEGEIAPGDCRIEWADGGIKREAGAIAAVIDEAVTRYIIGRGGEPLASGSSLENER